MTERRPSWVYRVGEDPDPRFSLANERTFLAWVRTALALVAGGVALYSLHVPEQPALRNALVIALVGLGAGTVAFSTLRWARVEQAMRTGAPLPSLLPGMLAALGLTAICLVVVVALALG